MARPPLPGLLMTKLARFALPRPRVAVAPLVLVAVLGATASRAEPLAAPRTAAATETPVPAARSAATTVSPAAPLPASPAGGATPVAASKAPTPLALVALVRFDQPEGVRRFERSRHKVDFFRLANQFEAQHNGGFCGLASGVVVLNALRVDTRSEDKPRDVSSIAPELAKRIPSNFDPFFARYTQATFMDERFERVKPRAVFFGQPPAAGQSPDPGLQLRQLGSILALHGLTVTVRVVDDGSDEKALKAEIVQNLKTSDDYVIVNYHRPALGQSGGGHLSPLAAYDQASDSFLVLDVNANAQRWVWAPAKALFMAMRTRGGAENRGFLLVKDAP